MSELVNFRPDDIIARPAWRAYFQPTPVGIQVLKRPTREAWLLAMQDAKEVQKAIHFIIGDLLNIGEAIGEEHTQALDELDYSDGTMSTDKWVCKSVEFSRRREGLSFAHHREVAPLPPEEQIEWLELAEMNGWSSKVLRDELRKDRGFSPLSSYVEGLESENGRLKSDLHEARARIAAEAAAQCADDPGAAADEAYQAAQEEQEQAAQWVTCPRCGNEFEVTL